jgi:glutamate synthase domain-containing protein 3
VGKGLSGGKIVLYPPKQSTFVAEDNIIVGNVNLYGAISAGRRSSAARGRALLRAQLGRHAVVEGLGDHGCEYMTGGAWSSWA